MKNRQLVRGTVIKTAFTSIELIVLVIMSVIAFTNDGKGVWGYWGSIIVIFAISAPVIVYTFASMIFNVFNIYYVFGDHHTIRSLEKYHKISSVYFTVGIMIGALYGFILLPIFWLENMFLLDAYSVELLRQKKAGGG